MHQTDPGLRRHLVSCADGGAKLQAIDLKETPRNADYLADVSRKLMPHIDRVELMPTFALALEFSTMMGRVTGDLAPAAQAAIATRLQTNAATLRYRGGGREF